MTVVIDGRAVSAGAERKAVSVDEVTENWMKPRGGWVFGYYGIEGWVDDELDAGEMALDVELYRCRLSPWLADAFDRAPQGDRDALLEEIRNLMRFHEDRGIKPTLKILTPVEGLMAKYTVGTSPKPVSKGDKERKARLGLTTVDRLRDLRTETLRLVHQATGLDDMTEGQYVEFSTRRLTLTKQMRELMEELGQIESDLDLVAFACEEAEQR